MLIGPRMLAAIAQQSRLSREIGDLNTQIATMKRIQRPSDDPVASARIANIARAQADETTWLANIESAAALAARVDARLGDAGDLADQATDIITRARSGVATPSDRAIAATELAAIANDLRAMMTGVDARGQPLFPTGAPLAVPVGRGDTLVAATTRDDAFGPPGQTLADLADAAAAAITAGDDAALATALDAMRAAQQTLAAVRGEQGVRMTRLDTARDRLIDTMTALTGERGALEATDLTQATPMMQAKMLTLEAAQAAFARINRRTLFDLLG